jgi:isochorismate synthase
VKRFVTTGDDRFATAIEATRALPPWARLFAGFAFSPARAAALPDAWVVWPRLVVRRRRGATRLTIVVDDTLRFDAIEWVERLLAAARKPGRASSRRATLTAGADDFAARVAAARDRISRGELDKVVLHRQTRVRHRLPTSAVLRQLARTQPQATRYAFRVNGRVFLGATPERLVMRRGRRVAADVLAGSLPRTGGAPGRSLMKSGKDRAEHELTRCAIDSTLRPFCRTLRDDGPRVRTLPHIHHLYTAVRGELAANHHVLSLVEALHPTPAVGGVPRAAALRFLSMADSPRLWYGGPIGWFRSDGDGDFRVALRCALLDGDEATLFAGAGIVAGSDPHLEALEVASKERAMAAALGIEATP